MTYAMHPPWDARRAFMAATHLAEQAARAQLHDEEDAPHARDRRPHGRGRGRRGTGPDVGVGPGFFGPGFFGPGFGPGMPGGRAFGGFGDFGPGRGRGPRARRGDVRAAVLSVLADEAMNGYQLIQQISERSNGAWRPSPGSVYPTLSQLEDEGLVAAQESEGRRTFALTEAGRDYAREHADEMAAPWAAFADGAAGASGPDQEALGELRDKGAALAAALFQVARAGTPAQRTAAVEVLDEARKRVYRILAEDSPQE